MYVCTPLIDTGNARAYTWTMPERPSPADDPARHARRAFSALDWKERARLISEAESRELRHYNRIMPLLQGAAFSPVAYVETATQAQEALLLECYYALLQATLKGQELFLAPWAATEGPQERDRKAAAWRRQAATEQALLQAVQERGTGGRSRSAGDNGSRSTSGKSPHEAAIGTG